MEKYEKKKTRGKPYIQQKNGGEEIVKKYNMKIS